MVAPVCLWDLSLYLLIIKNSLKKSFNIPERYKEIVASLHKYNISLMAYFTFGMDYDTPEIFMQTAQFCVDAHIDLPRFAIVTPFPGTPVLWEV